MIKLLHGLYVGGWGKSDDFDEWFKSGDVAIAAHFWFLKAY
jgi:hypothetical protein